MALEARHFEPGQRVLIRDSRGETLPRRATSTVEPGDTFPVVWACREDEWTAAQREQRQPDATPWPARDVEPAEK